MTSLSWQLEDRGGSGEGRGSFYKSGIGDFGFVGQSEALPGNYVVGGHFSNSNAANLAGQVQGCMYLPVCRYACISFLSSLIYDGTLYFVVILNTAFISLSFLFFSSVSLQSSTQFC